MKYQNRTPPEGINTPGRHPLKEFMRLSIFAIIALGSITLLLNYGGGQLGGVVPFKVESWVISRLDTALSDAGQESPFRQNPVDTPLEEYLNELASRVQTELSIEKPMSITLHYSDDDVFNAYATLGGHVTVFKGLLDKLPHENALVMLLAHEFSHVQLRHPARGLGGGLAVAAGTALLPGGSMFENRLFALTSNITTMRFSRRMETQSDEKGLTAVQRIYGHVNGADDLFELFMLQQEQPAQVLDTFFSTHPLDSARIAFIASHAKDMGWATEGQLTPLPKDFKNWLSE